jgi:hypothetical protein
MSNQTLMISDFVRGQDQTRIKISSAMAAWLLVKWSSYLSQEQVSLNPRQGPRCVYVRCTDSDLGVRTYMSKIFS